MAHAGGSYIGALIQDALRAEPVLWIWLFAAILVALVIMTTWKRKT